MMPSVPPWTGVVGGGLGILAAILAFVINWRKGRVDESALVLGEWRKLVDAHKDQIAAMASEIVSLRTRLSLAEGRISELETTVRDKDKHIAGLERTIAQNSQSTGHLLGRLGDIPDTETGKRIERDRRKK